jgi:hypothetical protein
VTEPEFDADGYPTEATLKRIKTWPMDSRDAPYDLLVFVQRAWNWPEWGITIDARRRRWLHPKVEPTRRWHVSTGGWSGNEDIIRALEANWMFWALSWQSTTRGGHYIFETFK